MGPGYIKRHDIVFEYDIALGAHQAMTANNAATMSNVEE